MARVAKMTTFNSPGVYTIRELRTVGGGGADVLFNANCLRGQPQGLSLSGGQGQLTLISS